MACASKRRRSRTDRQHNGQGEKKKKLIKSLSYPCTLRIELILRYETNPVTVEWFFFFFNVRKRRKKYFYIVCEQHYALRTLQQSDDNRRSGLRIKIKIIPVVRPRINRVFFFSLKRYTKRTLVNMYVPARTVCTGRIFFL